MKHEAMLYEKLGHDRVHCYLCAHHCRISPSRFGICGVRRNIGGTLYTLVYGDVIASHIDPIEKKPLYHFLPGSLSFSIATVGCNFHCGFCQNRQISQVSKKQKEQFPGQKFSARDIVAQAQQNGCQSIAYTYTEPTIFFEFAYDTARSARQSGLRNCFVTNGYMTEEALSMIRPFLDAANVDLKSFREETYRTFGAHLNPVLTTIQNMKKAGIWLEVTTLIIPEQNDTDAEIKDIAEFIASVDQDIPWHISRFHPDYQYMQRDFTPLETLTKAFAVGKSAGLRYIYLGNVSPGTDTFCGSCGKMVVKRTTGNIETMHIKDGLCAFCGARMKGIWE